MSQTRYILFEIEGSPHGMKVNSEAAYRVIEALENAGYANIRYTTAAEFRMAEQRADWTELKGE